MHHPDQLDLRNKTEGQGQAKPEVPSGKRLLTIQDISCIGKCSLTIALPVISSLSGSDGSDDPHHRSLEKPGILI